MTRYIDGPPGLELLTAVPPKPDNDHATARRDWSPRKKRAFEIMEPQALVLVATDGPVSLTLYDSAGDVKKRFGHNRGVWPAKLAKSAARGDSVTQTYDKFPLCYFGAQWRIWCRTRVTREKLFISALDLIAGIAERDGGLDELGKGAFDLGPNIDLQMMELEVHDIARRLSVATWDDESLSLFLDRVERKSLDLAALRRNDRRDPIEVALAMLLDEA